MLLALAKGLRGAAAFLAMLAVLGSPLEASACALEGCDATCLAQGVNPAATDVDPSPDDCAQSNCACVAGHCTHAAMPAAPSAVSPIKVARVASINFASVDLISGSLQTLDRPPRV